MLQWQSRWESDAPVLEFFAIGRMTQAFLSRSVKGGGRRWELKSFRFFCYFVKMGGYGECFFKEYYCKGGVI